MIPGLTIIPDYITAEHEAALIQQIEPTQEYTTTQNKRNTIKRYGSDLPYNGRMVSDQIPIHLYELCVALADSNIVNQIPDSVTINQYKKGQGIRYHVDSKKSGPIIIVLSLGGNATMLMRKAAIVKQFDISARSLVIMRDEARTDWQHSILPVENERFSIVFRKGTSTQ